jgi:hypothetical protein
MRSHAERLATALERAVASAYEDHRGFTAQVPVSRAAVIEARAELLSLAQELREHPRPATVALTHELLIDSLSPLYHPEREGELSAAARRARAA